MSAPRRPDLIDRTVRNLRRRKTDPTLTPEGVIRWLRAYYADGSRADRIAVGNPELRRGVLHARRDSRRWRNELLELPAFRRIVIACEGRELFDTFTTLTGIVNSVGHIQSMWQQHLREPRHPASWGRSCSSWGRELEMDAERLRQVAKNHPIVSETLTRYAEQLDEAALMNSQAEPWYPFDSNNIGARGKAAQDVDSAMSGWFVVELSELLPESVEQRYSALAELLRHAGLDIAPDRVRSIIVNRQRFRR